MTTGRVGAELEAPRTGSPHRREPRVLVWSTNAISDPGIDLAGSSHMHYSPEVVVISLPCTSGIKPSWVLYALQRGFDGVFIASDGDECGYLPDCSKRSARIVTEAQALLASHQLDGRRLRMSAICSVCAEPFTRQVRDFTQALAEMEL
jgi:F420-non-reducing hydrogenase iron-sulfur subunit